GRVHRRLRARRGRAHRRDAARRDHRAAARGARSAFCRGEGRGARGGGAGLLAVRQRPFDLRPVRGRAGERGRRGDGRRLPRDRRRLRDLDQPDGRARRPVGHAAMRYVSTRGGESASLDEALSRGLARDGGLFLPEPLPAFSPDAFAAAAAFRAVAKVRLAPLFAGSRLEGSLGAIVDETFAFPVPLRELSFAPGTAFMLELFHGPTAAFKDVGARFLAACLSRLEQGDGRPLTILVATSGDTGGAVAGAFHGRPGVQVVVLFPEKRVSARQRHQLTCWGGNVLSLEVAGSFDDCQALVKQAMGDGPLRGRFRFSSANSINVGRLLPQCTYYAYAALMRWRETGEAPSFVIPTGNLGNALACVLARRMGLPIGDIV